MQTIRVTPRPSVYLRCIFSAKYYMWGFVWSAEGVPVVVGLYVVD
jgi:hypothetical protein